MSLNSQVVGSALNQVVVDSGDTDGASWTCLLEIWTTINRSWQHCTILHIIIIIIIGSTALGGTWPPHDNTASVKQTDCTQSKCVFSYRQRPHKKSNILNSWLTNDCWVKPTADTLLISLLLETIPISDCCDRGKPSSGVEWRWFSSCTYTAEHEAFFSP